MTPLVGTRAAIEGGRDRGLHLGVQLHATIAGEVVADVAVGEARPAQAMTADVLLPWFSLTKVLTAIAVAHLVDEAALSFDDPVAAHLPDFGAHGKRAVTLRHLLTHTVALDRPAGTTEEAAGAALAPGWTPGQRAGYQPRWSFAVLGAVIGAVTGRDPCDYITEEVIEPCDMADTWLELPADREAAYGRRVGAMFDASTRPIPRAAGQVGTVEREPGCHPAASAVGPARDLVKPFELLLGGGAREGWQVLSPETAATIVSRHREGMRDETFGSMLDWGLGVMVNSWRYQRRPGWYGYGDHASDAAFGHGGVRSSVAFGDPVHGLAVAFVANGMPSEAANHERTQPVLTALYEDLRLASQRS